MEQTTLTPEWWASQREDALNSRNDWREWRNLQVHRGDTDDAWTCFRAMVTQADVMSTCEQYDGHGDGSLD